MRSKVSNKYGIIVEMFTLFKRKFNIALLWTAWTVAVFGFFLCSNHLVPNHHAKSFSGVVSSKMSQESHSKDLNECVDNYTYMYGGRGCVTGDVSVSFDRTSFTDIYVISNVGSDLSDNRQVKSPKTVSLHILHNVLQV